MKNWRLYTEQSWGAKIGSVFLSRIRPAIRGWTILLVCTQLALGSLPVHALSQNEDERRIDFLATEMLRREIDLERFYLRYRVEGSAEPRTRRVRYYLAQSAAASITLGSTLINVKQSGENLEHPSKISPGALRTAIHLGMVGTLFDGGSSAVELTSNSWIALKNLIQKKNPASAVKNVMDRVKEIDAMAAERDALIEKHPEFKGTAMYKAEGRVLRSFRDWCLSEFVEVYADIKSNQASYNVYYLLDIAADSLYMASYIYSLKTLKRSEFGGDVVKTGIVGDGLGIMSAPVSSWSYDWFYKFWRYRMRKKLKQTVKDTEGAAKVAMADLTRELASADDDTLDASGMLRTRIEAYLTWSARYDDVIARQMDDLRHQNKVALQGEYSGPLISGTFLAQDVLGAVAFYRLGKRPKAADSCFLAGSIASTAGLAFSLGLTNYWFFDEMWHRHKLRKKNQLPEQLFAERMKTLEQLEKSLVSNSPSPPRISSSEASSSAPSLLDKDDSKDVNLPNLAPEQTSEANECQQSL